MAEIETGKLQDLEAKAGEAGADGASEGGDVQKQQGMSAQQKMILTAVLTVVGAVFGGAGGQSLFGISEEKMDKRFEQQQKSFAEKITNSTQNLDNKMEIIRLQNENSAKSINSNAEEIREMAKAFRGLETRVTKIEAKLEGGD